MKQEPLSRERIVDAAAEVADQGGLGAVSMRNVGRSLGVEAMSLYHHIPNKEALLDALTEWIFARVELPGVEDGWRTGMERRAHSLRTVLVDHPWALSLVDARAHPGPAQLAHHDAVIGCLRRGGFSMGATARAYSVLDAYIYGFALTERNLPFDTTGGTGPGEIAEGMAESMSDYPNLMALTDHLVSGGDYAFAGNFADGLGIILDRLQSEAGSSG